MKDKLVRGFSQVVTFLLRGAGWAAVGVFVGFVVSNFFRLPGRFDTFTFTETMLGVIITGLSIVGAFIVALQWSNLDSKMHAFDVKVNETNEFFEKASNKAIEVGNNIDEYVKSTLDNYTENVTYLQSLLEENAKNSHVINASVEEYKQLYVEKMDDFDRRQSELEERQNELGKIVKDSGVLIEKVEEILASQSSKTE